MTATLFVVVALAAYRLTRLVRNDLLFASWRHRWYRRFPPNAHYQAMVNQPGRGWVQSPNPIRPIHPLGQLIDCAWCCGFWITAALVAVTAQFVSVPQPALVVLAVSTAVGFVAKVDS